MTANQPTFDRCTLTPTHTQPGVLMTDTLHTAVLPLEQGVWTLDVPHSSIVFSIRHLGLSKVRGRFGNFDATLSVGPSLDDVQIEATIDVASVDTNHADRDAHLRSTDFFAVDAHPTIHFTSTRLVADGRDYTMLGEPTINGATHPIELPVEFNGIEAVNDERHAGFSADGELRRSAYGIDFGILPLGADKLALADVVKFELDLQFVEPTAHGTAA